MTSGFPSGYAEAFAWLMFWMSGIMVFFSLAAMAAIGTAKPILEPFFMFVGIFIMSGFFLFVA